MRRTVLVAMLLASSIAHADGPRVTVEGDKIRIEIGTHAPMLFDGDTSINDVLKSVQAKLRASPECKRGAKPTTPVRYATATFAAAKPTDAVFTVDADKPSTGVLGVVALLAYPTTVLVRDPSSGKTTPLGLRFCPAYKEAPESLPSTIELSNGHVLIPVASGGFDRDTTDVLEKSATAEELAAAMREQARGLRIETVRLTMHENVDVGRLLMQVQVAKEVGASKVVLLLEARREPDILTVELASVNATGIDKSRARAAVVAKLDAIRTCVLQRAFEDPSFGKRVSLTLQVTNGIVKPVARGFARCLTDAFGNATIAEGSGTLTIALSIVRTDPSKVVPSEPLPSLTGTGDF